MSLLEINLRPTDRQLRQFGAICLFALPVFGWLWGGSWPTIAWLTIVGGALAVAGLIVPATLKPIFLALTIVSYPIGLVVSEVVLAVVYFGIFLPVALIFRLMRRDPLLLKRSRQQSSYWQLKKQPSGVASYYRQS
jgi:hypothetical protein